MRPAWGNSFPGTSNVNTDSWCLPVMDKLHFADQESMMWDMFYNHLKKNEINLHYVNYFLRSQI